MTNTQRRISLNDLPGAAVKPAALSADDLPTLLQSLGRGLADITSIRARVDKLESDHDAITKALDKVQAVCVDIKSKTAVLEKAVAVHEKMPHTASDQAERNVDGLIKLVRNVTGQFSALQDEVAQALREMAQRRDVPVILETKVSAAPVTVNNVVEDREQEVAHPPTYKFDIQRQQNGLLKSITATPVQD